MDDIFSGILNKGSNEQKVLLKTNYAIRNGLGMTIVLLCVHYANSKGKQPNTEQMKEMLYKVLNPDSDGTIPITAGYSKLQELLDNENPLIEIKKVQNEKVSNARLLSITPFGVEILKKNIKEIRRILDICEKFTES